MTKHKPATPLPTLRVNSAGHCGDYSIDNEDSSVEFGRFGSRVIAHEVVRRANAYPRLVEALREAMHQVTKAEDCRAIQDLLVSIGEIK